MPPLKGKYRLLSDEDAYYFGSDRVVRNADAFSHHSYQSPLVVMDAEQRVIEANEDFCFLTGYLEDELCDLSCTQLFPGFDLDPFWTMDYVPFPTTHSLNVRTQSGALLEAQVEIHLAVNLLDRRYLVLMVV